MAQPVKFEISVSVTVSEDGTVTPVTRIFVDSKQIGAVNRLRVDADSDDVLPSVEVDLLRGMSMDMVPESMASLAQESFDLLKKVPGVKCRMPAPRKT